MLKIGIDLGSTAIKAVICEGETALWRGVAATVPGQEAVARRLINEGLQALGQPAAAYAVAAAGYAKKLFTKADKYIDEVSANALGLCKLSAGAARFGVNVGGQDLKIIRLSPSGAVLDFKMNDKCAAGTGRFFEQAARILDVPLADFAALAAASTREIDLNSTCVVFAESEIVSLLAGGAQKEDVARALFASVARRLAGFLGGFGDEVLDGVYLDGGPAQNAPLAAALSAETGAPVRVLPEPQFTVAYGAALSLRPA